MSVWKHKLDTSMSFKKEKLCNFPETNFMYKTISLPGDRVFVIGGSKDISGSNCTNQTHELVDGKFESRTNMWINRAAFGCAVYPNFSQIFIAGGKINANEATKQCERYIVANNQWKRLPELREAKFSVSLCFFNNGSTLYCFGGIYQDSPNSMRPSNRIERLSKGQNSW